MHFLTNKISQFFARFPMFFGIFLSCCFFIQSAGAETTDKMTIVDSYNLAPFVPLVLEIMMTVATSLYKYFVGNGTGIIYILIYGFLAFYLSLYLFKMHLPKNWLSFIGFSGGGEMMDSKTTGWTIADNVLKPCFRAIIAMVVLLQIKPVYMTEWLVNPFLEFGALYTNSIMQSVSGTTPESVGAPKCSKIILKEKWISERSCNFLIQPVFIISKKNNDIIKYGWGFFKSGLRGMMTLIPHGGEDLLNIITGILLLVAFISSNVFMALLIIQGIFDFCMALIMYPFSVLAWVAKKSDKWFDVFPAFKQIIDSLKNLVITMIACAFILCINIAAIRALFNWSSSVFVVAAGGVATSNVPTVANSAMNFGEHSILWLSSLLTFFLMQNIFKLTRERLDMYTNGVKHTLYDNVTKDAKTAWGKIKSVPGKFGTLLDIGEKIRK